MLAFLRLFLWNQAVAMSLVKGEKKIHKVHIDHSDKTFWKSLLVGISCAFYWLLAVQSFFYLNTPRPYYGCVFVAVGFCSIGADSGLFRDHHRVMRMNQYCDRWMATIGTMLILYEVLLEFALRSIWAGMFFVFITLVSFFTLQSARERVHTYGHDWGWVALHCLWHFLTVAGTLVIVYRADTSIQ